MKRTITITMALLLGIASVCAQGKFKITQMPYLQNVEENEVTILWETNRPGIGWVEIAPDDSSNFYAYERERFYDSSIGIRQIGKVHKVTVNGLQPDTRYRYRVLSQEVLETGSIWKTYYGAVAATNVYKQEPLEFTTAGAPHDSYRFIVMNDVHEDSTLFHDLAEAGKVNTADFVVFNGDMVSDMNEENNLSEKFLSYTTALFASEKPFYMARGNHETRGPHAEQYMMHFATPTGLPYYTFMYGETFFIVLDSGEDKADSDHEYSGRADYDQYREKEALWLTEVLESKEYKEAEHKIAFMHIPLVGKRGWHGDMEVRRLFLDMLNKAGLDLMLCAHTHEYAYYPAGADKNLFPVIVNDNEAVCSISVDPDAIAVSIYDRTGKKMQDFRYRK